VQDVWEAIQWLLTLLLGAGYVDTRRKIKADRELRRENNDVAALDDCLKRLEDLREVYAHRRERRHGPWKVTDESIAKATRALDNAVRRVTSAGLAPLVAEYNDVAGQYADRAEEIGVEDEARAYAAIADAVARKRRQALEP
jgi:hypothetical protein